MKKVYKICILLMCCTFLFSFTVYAKESEGLPEEYSLDVTFGEIQDSIVSYIEHNNLSIEIGSEGYTKLLDEFLFEDLDISATLLEYYTDYASHYKNVVSQGESFDSELSLTLRNIKEKNAAFFQALKNNNTNPQVKAYSKFDVAKAQAYAKRYATSWNYVYGRFSSDCTNFASQLAVEGGIRENSEWQWNGTGMALRNWRVAQDFTEYMTLDRGYNGGLYTARADVNRVATPGDCIAYMKRGTTEIFHVAFVQSKQNGLIYLTQHTDDFYNVKFNDRVSEEKMNGSYYIVVIDFAP